jgi:hypothetical protein
MLVHRWFISSYSYLLIILILFSFCNTTCTVLLIICRPFFVCCNIVCVIQFFLATIFCQYNSNMNSIFALAGPCNLDEFNLKHAVNFKPPFDVYSDPSTEIDDSEFILMKLDEASIFSFEVIFAKGTLISIHTLEDLISFLRFIVKSSSLSSSRILHKFGPLNTICFAEFPYFFRLIDSSVIIYI